MIARRHARLRRAARSWPRRPTPWALGAAITRMCAEIGVERPHVAGNSLGGWVALEMAKADAASSLCLISPAGLWRTAARRRGTLDSRKWGKRLRPLIMGLTRIGPVREAMLRTSIGRPDLRPRRRRPGDDRRLDRRARIRRPRTPRCAATSPRTSTGSPSRRRSSGASSTASSARRGPSAGRPESRYVQLPGLGHTPNWDDPDLIARAPARGQLRIGETPGLRSRDPLIGEHAQDPTERTRIEWHEGLTRDELRTRQAPLKESYRDDPETAQITLRADGSLESGIACSVQTGKALVEAGLHPGTGGEPGLACSGDMLLQALVACAGVTMRSVATSMELDVTGTVRAEGDLDWRGTLAIDKETPVGFRDIRLLFEIESDASEEELATLERLTERYCVVLQTLASSPGLSTTLKRI